MRILTTCFRWLLRIATALGLVVMLVSTPPLLNWWLQGLSGPWNDPSGDVLIVLTGSTVGETIGVSSYWRAVYASRVFLEEGFHEMIVTGGGDGTPAAVPMGKFIVSQGVPEAAVRLETASNNTRESGEQVARILREDPARYGGRRVVLLTSDYHMYRSSRVFKQAGIDFQARPIPDALKRESVLWLRWGVFVELIQETAKIAYYQARGWI